MTQVFATIAMAFSVSFSVSAAHASYSFDGCYQLYRPGSMHAAVCLQGTEEEGISGAGARFVIFLPNTNQIYACGAASNLRINGSNFELVQNCKTTFALKNVNGATGRLEGDAVLGRDELKFLQLGREFRGLLSVFDKEPRCKNLSAGDFRKFN